MTYILGIDPGMSTGIVLGEYTDDTPFEVIEKWQVERGIHGWLAWKGNHVGSNGSLIWTDGGIDEDPFGMLAHWDVIKVCEKFIPRPMARSFKLDEVEPIRIEGSVLDTFRSVVWQRPPMMVLAEGDTPAERKRASDDVLRRMGLWSTPKSMGPEYTLKDCNDINSAMKHIVAYLRSQDHQPTLEAMT